MRGNKFNMVRLLSVPCTAVLLSLAMIACSEMDAPTAVRGESPAAAMSDADGDDNPVIHRASLGGADICEALGLPTGCDANFSLVALERADGSVSGQWQDTFAGGGEGIHVAVDCINVVGNGAVIGGEITTGTANGVDVAGQRALTAVVDNGTSANDAADQLSFSFFPAAANCTDLIADQFLLFDLTNGQVKVW